MEEIGGYIEFEYNHGAMLHENSIHLNCARRAFSYLIKSRNIRKVWLPILSCDSVIEPFISSNCEINFFSVDSHFFPLINNIPTNEWIVIINYYGQIDNSSLSAIKEKYSHIIFDNTQAYFQSPLKDVDTIYSCRKFFGVSDGAFLYTNSVIEDNLEVDESYKRMTYLIGRFERSASEFYSLFDKNNSIFDAEPIKKMSKFTENILHGLDYQLIAQKRKNNYEYLHSAFSSINFLKLSIPSGPFMYPLYVDNASEIKKYLLSQKIYIPTLWPNVLDVCTEDQIEFKLVKNILPLPIDQRYDINHMKRIKESILKCLN